ncbi:WecB/TagA/CpsF family glycosyltransferase [Woeseia oceani]|uniref:N-acetylglucosaminyldiphospho-UDP N-acetyl-beta-D-mannosaminyltransferase n=1 Tax=Woeseia oceani TaxID=1548547 RepID=A0A193LEJ6_9GAMM|nr:WecB/TagA/CpsF family glycosyltransferase [Woeseia oceani]ANO50932.1 N-acetylglucosaminyldiphospho-UDP N-acetyl-beta-D-mannosaminyltransferase [Woeseia oceani]
MKTESILGYDVTADSKHDLLDEIVNSGLAGRDCTSLACFNPHSYAVARRDRSFSNALSTATYLVPDGAGVILASSIFGGTIRRRITGFDIFVGLHEKLNRRGGACVFFLGSTEQTLEKIRVKMASDYPNIKVAGTYSPPFKVEFDESDIEEMVARVNASGADVLWVGMTAPKQEKWTAAVCDRLNVNFVASIGAVFDFYVGNIERSHIAFQRLGLEWLPRLLKEPRRLWRRMFISAPVFLWQVMLARLGGKS